jgi:hypothetical protein
MIGHAPARGRFDNWSTAVLREHAVAAQAELERRLPLHVLSSDTALAVVPGTRNPNHPAQAPR